jgi:hypothetical protein
VGAHYLSDREIDTNIRSRVHARVLCDDDVLLKPRHCRNKVSGSGLPFVKTILEHRLFTRLPLTRELCADCDSPLYCSKVVSEFEPLSVGDVADVVVPESAIGDQHLHLKIDDSKTRGHCPKA